MKFQMLPLAVLGRKSSPSVESGTNILIENRRIKVINIGAGVVGILNAYKIQKNCQKSASESRYNNNISSDFSLQRRLYHL